jgi:Flp pilus assembly protein TadB
MAFLIVTVIFTAVEVVASPLITRLSQNNLPALKGGVALVTTFVGLWITSLFVQGMTLGGLANWLGATLLVWLGALIVVIVLPIFVFKSLREDRKG